MTREPIEINGETFEPVIRPCPVCGVEIDAQRAFYERRCPDANCRAKLSQLLGERNEGAPADYEADSYKIQA